MTSLHGRRVLVVGASAGIGRAFAVAAGRAGARLALAARRTDRLQDALGDVGDGVAIAADVRRPEDCRRLVAEAVDHLGPLDLLFYAAGSAPLRRLADTDEPDWQDVFATNVIGVQHVLRAVVPQLVPDGIAAVVSSEIVGRPRPHLGAYGSSKAALDESLRVWRLEHPEARFSCLTVGATAPTGFADDFDREALGPAFVDWQLRGLVQEDVMHTDELAGFLTGLLAAALAHPGIGVEQIVLRSPSRVVGT